MFTSRGMSAHPTLGLSEGWVQCCGNLGCPSFYAVMLVIKKERSETLNHEILLWFVGSVGVGCHRYGTVESQLCLEEPSKPLLFCLFLGLRQLENG